MKEYKGYPYKIINNTAYVFRNKVDYLINRASPSLCYVYSDKIDQEEQKYKKQIGDAR